MHSLLILLSFLVSTGHTAEKWGANGHRVVGEIASTYMTTEALLNVNNILQDESVAIASNWMDEIKADTAYDYMYDWHWVTIPTGMSYVETEKNPNGDVIWAIEKTIRELKQGGLTRVEEEQKIKILIHLVGDIHQPLHVGTGDDRGGNEVKVEWFYEPSNLHRVWDSGMIESVRLSYTELAASINYTTPEQVKRWQSTGVREWARESVALRDRVYDLPKDKQLGYRYRYENYQIVERRLLQAGIRLAGILNEIYG